MKEKIISALASLLKVKSIITLLTFVAFFYLSITEKIASDNFMLIMGMIATYFFNKDQVDKKVKTEDEIYEVINDE